MNVPENEVIWRHVLAQSRMFYNEPRDVQDILYDNYCTLLHLRHDLLHLFVSDTLGQIASLGTSMKVKNLFPNLTFDKKLGKLTPDIVVINGLNVTIIDVSITTSPEFSRSEKILKYQPVQRYLMDNGYVCGLIIIACNTQLGNLTLEMFQLHELVPYEPNQRSNRLINDIGQIQQMSTELRAMIPDSYFQKGQIENFRTEFKTSKEYKKVYSSNIHATLDKRKEINIEEAYSIMSYLEQDTEVRQVMKDKPHDIEEFDIAFKNLKSMDKAPFRKPKPTFHFLFVPSESIKSIDSIKAPENLTKFERKDQIYSYKILKFCSMLKHEDKRLVLVKHLFENLEKILENEDESRIFATGFFTGDHAEDLKIKTEYCIKNKIKKEKAPFQSIRSIKSEKYTQKKPYAERSHQIAIKITDDKAKEQLIRSGVKYRQNNPEGRKYKEPMSCKPESTSDFEVFKNMISEPSNTVRPYDDLFDMPIGLDTPSIMEIKAGFRNEYKYFHSIISNTNAIHMSYHTSLAADQAIHYTSLNTKDTSFCFLNTGLKNVLHIYQGGTLNRGSDTGCPFFSIAVTTDKRWANSVWGEILVLKVRRETKFYVIITDWRRLQIPKLCLLRDQYFSCLSTGFDTYQRNKTRHNSSIQTYKSFIYTFRTLVAQCTSQKVAEFLMDVRYVIMSCYSDYTNVTALISDKFAPTYPNVFSRWIIVQLEKKVISISNAFKNGVSYRQNKPIFLNTERIQSSMGGQILLPSLWTDHQVRHMQDLFDELFVYVHTGKEPSSNFMEGVKSLKTILKFQEEYNKLTDSQKLGLHDVNSFKSYLLSKKQVGCFYDIIVASSREVSNDLPIDKIKNSIDKHTCQEVLSEIVSTKACLPEYKLMNDIREEVLSKKSKKKKQKQDEQLEEHLKKQGLKIIQKHIFPKQKFENLHPDTVLVEGKYNKRAKVHDLCLDFILRFEDKSQCVLDVGHWNMFENKNRVEADICIKAQYGAKREFYVVNFGAKAMVRVYENIFKSIAIAMPQEMISVPGDQKMMNMSANVNDVLRAKTSPDDLIYYVNGDCTKWSACETFTSFWGMCEGLSNVIGLKQSSYCKAVLAGWSEKNILVPSDILNGTHFITEKTTYMGKNGKIKSTQNFLQGMFNYSSSVKSVIATEFAIKYWNYKYGALRPLIVKHLEHSDDYNLIIRTQNKQDFEDFRIIHKISQKMHGISDSEKKTNSQRFLMEFISLMCFNGQMAYPNIKKTKEVGINIAGVGYQHDAMNIISRTSEALRVGVPQVSCYIVQMLQGINIYRKYSLVQKGRNENDSSQDPFNNPIELFGLPDCLPAFYINTVGDPNNYRLYKYNPAVLKFMKGLYYHTIHLNEQDYDPLLSSTMPSFFTSIYSYRREGKKLQIIKRKLNWSSDQIEEYRKTNPEYMVMKPRETQKFKEWLKYMYYNKSFSTAYTIASRKMIMLRLSHFASSNCIVNPFTADNELITIRSFTKIYRDKLQEMSGKFNEAHKHDLERLLLNTDPTLQAIFTLLDKSAIIPLKNEPSKPLITRFPQPYQFLKMENKMTSVLQYMVSPDNYSLDRRLAKSDISLKRDVDKLKLIFGNDCTTADKLIQINKVLKSQKSGNTVGLCFSTTSGFSPADTIEAYIENGMYYNTQFKLLTQQQFIVEDPITGQVMYSRDFLYTADSHSIMLENMSLLTIFLTAKMELDEDEIRKILNQTIFTETGKTVVEELKNCIFDMDSMMDTYHKKMFSFFSDFLLGDSIPLQKMLSSQYSVKHGYLNKFELRNFQDRGLNCIDGLTFLFRSSTYMAFKITHSEILLLSNTTSYSSCIMAYFIALRLFNMITQSVFEKYMMERPDTEVPNLNETFLNRAFTKRENFINKHTKVYKKVGPVIRCDSDFDTFKPILLNIDGLYWKQKDTLQLQYDAYVDVKYCCVRIGKIVLYNLPINPCGNHIIVKFPDYKLLDGVNLNVFNTPKLLYSYIKEEQLSVNLDKSMIENFVGLFGSAFFESIWNFEQLKKEDISKEVLYEPDSKKELTSDVITAPKYNFDEMDEFFSKNVKLDSVQLELEELVFKESTIEKNKYSICDCPAIKYLYDKTLYIEIKNSVEGKIELMSKEKGIEVGEDDCWELEFRQFESFCNKNNVKEVEVTAEPQIQNFASYYLSRQIPTDYGVLYYPTMSKLCRHITVKYIKNNNRHYLLEVENGDELDEDSFEGMSALICKKDSISSLIPKELEELFPYQKIVHSSKLSVSDLKNKVWYSKKERLDCIIMTKYIVFHNSGCLRLDETNIDCIPLLDTDCYIVFDEEGFEPGLNMHDKLMMSLEIIDKQKIDYLDFVEVTPEEISIKNSNEVYFFVTNVKGCKQYFIHPSQGLRTTVKKVKEFMLDSAADNIFVYFNYVPERAIRAMGKGEHKNTLNGRPLMVNPFTNTVKTKCLPFYELWNYETCVNYNVVAPLNLPTVTENDMTILLNRDQSVCLSISAIKKLKIDISNVTIEDMEINDSDVTLTTKIIHLTRVGGKHLDDYNFRETERIFIDRDDLETCLKNKEDLFEIERGDLLLSNTGFVVPYRDSCLIICSPLEPYEIDFDPLFDKYPKVWVLSVDSPIKYHKSFKLDAFDFDDMNLEINLQRENQPRFEDLVQDEEIYSEGTTPESPEMLDDDPSPKFDINIGNIVVINQSTADAPYIYTKVRNLPSLYLFLLRSWSGYSALGWLRNPLNVFNVCRLYYKLKQEGWSKVDDFTRVCIQYLYDEILAQKNKNLVTETLFRLDNLQSIAFDGDRFCIMAEKPFFLEELAAKYATEHHGEVVDRGEYYVVACETTHKISKETLLGQFEFNTGSHFMFKHLAQVCLDLGLVKLK
jgi:hypothetical protein